ncbi:MAG TPA: hypothetical protein VMT55_01915, partial [Candidatus Sulfotelmatobacter sp.]|nr:hypothetical protein [Candidatus Sulfotelmatobacter sp.]
GFLPREDREASYEKMKDAVLSDMKKDFRPEFLNRIDEIIIFHPLNEEELKQIAGLIIADLQKQVVDRGQKLEVTDEVKARVIKDGYEPKYGARPLRRAVQHLLENPLSNEIISGKFQDGDIITAGIKDDKIVFEKTGHIEKPIIPPAAAKPPEAKKIVGGKDEPTAGEIRKKGRKKTS